jgi:hypothetical protein
MLKHEFFPHHLFVFGLPDGIFSDQKSQFWFIFVGFGIKNLGIFYGHLK